MLLSDLLELMERPEKNLLYIITLSLAVLFNYYSGYMICIFALLFFIAESLKRGFSAKAALSFTASSLIAVLLTAFNLIPAVLSLRGEKTSFAVGFFRTFSLRAFPRQFFAGSFKGNVSTGLPNVYCGAVVLVFFIIYLFNKKIELKDRMVSLLFCLFLCLNFWLNIFNIVWHGFNQPIGFPYRYSYMLSFIMILCAHRAFQLAELKRCFVILLSAAELLGLSCNY